MGGTERATAAARHRCRRAAAIRSEWQNFYLKLRFFSSWPLCRDRGAYFSYLGMYKQRGEGHGEGRTQVPARQGQLTQPWTQP